MNWKIPLFKIYWDEDDIAGVTEAIKRGINWATGPNIKEFERLLSEYIGTKHAVVFNSGTSALHAILAASGYDKECEIIVPSFTFVSTANASLFVGAKTTFADIEADTYGLDPEDVVNKITSRTKAIIAVHYGGCPCRILELRQIAQKYDLHLIEDAAESFGAAIDGRRVGVFGTAGILSFCAPKVITTGEGGAVVTDSDDLFEKLKLIRSHGRAETSDYFSTSEYLDYVTLGYNFRMSNITAALGISQLKKVDRIIGMRRRNADRMSRGLSQTEGISLLQNPGNFFQVYQMYTIMVDEGQDKRDALARYLADKGIMTKVYFSPVHLSHFYRNELNYNCELPVTEKLSNQVLTLPMYPTLTDDEIDYVVDAVRSFFIEV